MLDVGPIERAPFEPPPRVDLGATPVADETGELVWPPLPSYQRPVAEGPPAEGSTAGDTRAAGRQETQESVWPGGSAWEPATRETPRFAWPTTQPEAADLSTPDPAPAADLPWAPAENGRDTAPAAMSEYVVDIGTAPESTAAAPHKVLPARPVVVNGLPPGVAAVQTYPGPADIPPVELTAPHEPPPGPPPPPKAPSGSRQILVIGAIVTAVAVLAALGVVGYRTMGASSGPPAAKSGPTAPSAAASASAVDPSRANSEQTDPRPLEATEAFPAAKVTLAGRTYTRVRTQVDEDCSRAALGPFARALKQQQCRRVVRATYVDAQRRYAVTSGIAVLPTKEAALRADQAKNLKSNLWFRGLPGPKASGTAKVHVAGGYAAGLVWGRYIIFSYATYADGHTPDPADRDLAPVSGAFRDHAAAPIEKRVTG